MQPPSWILFFVIVISGVIAVTANAWYPVVKAREERAELASNAKAILLLEVKRNGEFVSTIQASLVKRELYLEQFDVTACEAISKGGLLLGLEPRETTKFLRVCRLAYQANDQSAQLVDAAGIRIFCQRPTGGNIIVGGRTCFNGHHPPRFRDEEKP